MVTVPEEGLLHVMVVDSPALTSRVLWPSGMLMAFSWVCARTRELKSATAAYKKRMLNDRGCRRVERLNVQGVTVRLCMRLRAD